MPVWRHMAVCSLMNLTRFKSHWTEFEEGKRLIQVYHENFRSDGMEVLAIEEPFSFIVDGLDVPVVGIFHLIEIDRAGTIVVSDFKTCGHGYTNDEIDRSVQLTMYGMGAKANGYRDREVLLRFDCLVKTKQPYR